MGHIRRSISNLKVHCHNVCELCHRHTAIGNALRLHCILYRNLAIAALLVTTLLATTFLSHPTSAVENIKEQSNNISLSVSTQCSFVTTNGASLNNSYEATGANGNEATFNDNGIHNFNIACNQFSGYTVKAYAEDLVNTEDANNVVTFYNYSEYAPRVQNNSDVAIWSAEITSGGNEGATFGNSSENAQIIKSRDTASELTGDPFSIQYHAYIGRTTAPGVYNGKAVYTIAMNPYNPTSYMYTVNYHSNGIANTPDPQYGETTLGEDSTVTLSTNLPSITVDDTTYTALGWDTSPTATTVVYSAGETITIPETSPVLNLYAVWAQGSNIWGITYDANGGSMTPTITATISPDSSDTTVNVTTIVPVKNNGYFLGWSEDANATAATYLPGSDFTLTSSHSNVTLYAVWQTVDSTMTNGNYLQAMTADSCANVQRYSTSGITYQLVDMRDNHSYLVRKLDDDNCWMVQNLSLYAGTSISVLNTDLNGTSAESTAFISNWNNATSVTAGSSKWTSTDTVYQVYNGTYQANTKNTTVSSNNTPTANTGSYYPYIVATAGYDTSVASGQAGDSSICPRGWKLPTGGSSGQFQALYTAYSSNSSNFQSAMNINSAYPGFCNSSSCPNASSNVRLWSSTIYSASNGYSLLAGSSSVSPTNSNGKYNGLSVRCVLGS